LGAAVTWYKGVRELTYGQRYRMMAENDGHHVMQIPSTMQQDSGEFTVTASNPLGTVKYTTLVNVLAPRPGVTPAASEFEWSAAPLSTLFTQLKPNSITLAASELVRSWFEAGSKPNSITLSGSNQLRTSFEPDSVMEFRREPASSC